MPNIGTATARLLQSLGFTGNGKVWRQQQVEHDITHIPSFTAVRK